MVTSAGVTIGELPLTRQQHSIARSVSGPGTDTMVMTGAAGRAPEEQRQETFLSCPLRTVGGTLPEHTVPAVPCAHEVVPALRIARQRPTDPQILHVCVRVIAIAPDC